MTQTQTTQPDRRPAPAHPGGWKIGVIGCGQIGSFAGNLLARQPDVREMLFIDPEKYGQENLPTQNISHTEIGRPKAVAAAQRALLTRPCAASGAGHVQFTAQGIVDRVENIPWGLLRDCDLLCACVDSRHARVRINRVASRLGKFWLDAGVQGAGLLARVNIYSPGTDTPCLECPFGPRDYELLAHSYSCDGRLKAAASSNSPAPLGALAASMLALECQKLFAGEIDQALISRQCVIESRHHQHLVNTLRRNPACRFDHETWSIDRIDGPLHTLGDLAKSVDIGGPIAIAVERNPWVTRVACPQCGLQTHTLCLQSQLESHPHRCEACGHQAMQPMGFFSRSELAIPAPGRNSLLDRPLDSLGLRPGDVVTVHAGQTTRHFELASISTTGGA